VTGEEGTELVQPMRERQEGVRHEARFLVGQFRDLGNGISTDGCLLMMFLG
jgi:hypothetical protein